MTLLLLVEFRRLLARRVVRFAGAMVLLGMLIAGVVLFVRSHRTEPGAQSSASARVEAERDRQIAKCARTISPSDVPPGFTAVEFCKELVSTPSTPDPEFHLTHYQPVAEGLSGLFIALLLVLGASSAGAEWHAGTVTTQLTWEARRTRLLLAKIIVAAVFGFVAFVLAEMVLLGVVAPAAVFRGTTSGVDAEWVRGTVAVLLRAAVLAAMGSAIAHSLAWLARNTAVAVGAALGYAAVIEPLLRAARPKWEPWFLVTNAIRFVAAHPLDIEGKTRSTMGAALLLTAYTVGLVLLSLAVFRRRDVT
jgi:ABC-2 type transport system permease protein